MADFLRHNTPYVRDLGCNQNTDAANIAPTDREPFQELAYRWENETVLLSHSAHAAEHPYRRQIVSISELVVSLLLELNTTTRIRLQVISTVRQQS